MLSISRNRKPIEDLIVLVPFDIVVGVDLCLAVCIEVRLHKSWCIGDE
ncbi:hypothetical protein SDC9_151801 [bioreactor metagenome]|uniref:Uncharacterized protein n=1 Tax=bioreactor metagenome TaxID=1076179 RepID=A0A645ET20_9ZZZZ